MLRILTITDSLSQRAGGLSNATFFLALQAALLMPNDFHYILAQKDIEEIDVGKPLPDNFLIKKVDGSRNVFFPWSSNLQEALIAINPDVIHLRGLWRQSSFACLAWKQVNPRKSLIVQPAGMLEPKARLRNRFFKDAYYQIFERKLIDIADVIHVTSAQERHSLIRLGVGSDRIVQLAEGVTLPADRSDALTLTDQPRRLLMMSRLDPIKGIELLLEAMSIIRPRGWICEIAGGGAISYVHQLKQLVVSFDLSDFVRFLGPLSGDEKNKAFERASAFVLPSLSESFGISIAEAMAWQLPVLTTTGTPWRAISELDLGWYVPPDLNGLSQALFELFFAPPARLADMGKRSRHFVSQRYQWSEIGRQMVSLYRALDCAQHS